MIREPSRRGPRHGAFTMIEAAVCLVIVSLMLVAALDLLGASARNRRIQAGRDAGPALARSLMAEILQMHYQEPDDTPTFGRESSESGGARGDWDDVDDYHGWSASPPEDRAESPVPGRAGWTRAVSVQLLNPASPTLATSATDEGLKRITVTVTAPNGEHTALVALRSADSNTEHRPTNDTEYVTGFTLDLRIGSDPATASGRVVNFLNRLPTINPTSP